MRRTDSDRRRRARRVAIACAAAVLGGCMVGPNYERPDVPLPSSYPDAAAIAAAAGDIRPDWWTVWNDPMLDGLVDDALARNTDVAQAAARVEEAEAILRQANAALFPEIDLDGTVGRARTLVTGGGHAVNNAFRIALSTSFEIDFWGRLRRLVEAARAQTLATQYASDVVRLSFAALTVQTYFSVRSLDAQIAATRDTLDTRTQYLDLVRRRAEGGVSSDLELYQARGTRADAAAQLDELIRQRAVATHLLGVLTGRLELALPPSRVEALPIPAMPPPGLPSELLERRPDVRQAEQALVAANAQIGAARAAMFPAISLTGGGGASSLELTSLLHGGNLIWSVAAGLAMPIFTAGRLQAAVEAATARQREAVFAYQGTVQTAFREVEDALSNISGRVAQESSLAESVDAARNSLRLASQRYEAGYSPFLEVLDAQRTVNTAELAYIRNRQALLAAQVDLLRALGGGWQVHDAQVSTR